MRYRDGYEWWVYRVIKSSAHKEFQRKIVGTLGIFACIVQLSLVPVDLKQWRQNCSNAVRPLRPTRRSSLAARAAASYAPKSSALVSSSLQSISWMQFTKIIGLTSKRCLGVINKTLRNIGDIYPGFLSCLWDRLILMLQTHLYRPHACQLSKPLLHLWAISPYQSHRPQEGSLSSTELAPDDDLFDESLTRECTNVPPLPLGFPNGLGVYGRGHH